MGAAGPGDRGSGAGGVTPGRGARRWAVVGLGALWWWAVARLVLAPDGGALEGAVAAGGWGLSVLPVHCTPKARAQGALAAGRWRRAWRSRGRGTR
ncbi:hypothetical protein GCM10010280_27690 [Streptomyces pilosus]|uniref:Uncharacterized protein n=1 Tax=Streptomyces pilosus TaxID=28893 RepID=A0A918BNI1_9ACTN|nr:hypothetical protein GCM10010280_27690 [Streptomyces pilosus]